MPTTRTSSWATALAMVFLGLTGCSQLNPQTRIEGLNARRLPENVLAVKRSNKEPLEYVMLRQDPPEF